MEKIIQVKKIIQVTLFICSNMSVFKFARILVKERTNPEQFLSLLNKTFIQPIVTGRISCRRSLATRWLGYLLAIL